MPHPLRSLVLVMTALLHASLLTAQPADTPASNLGATATKSPALAKNIILVGGEKSNGPGMHVFTNCIPPIAAGLKAAPAFADADVLAYTGGWPEDLGVLDGATTIACYFDGVQEKPEPLNNPSASPNCKN